MVVGLLCVGPSSAPAQTSVELEPLRSWPVPLRVSPHTADVDAGVDGAFLMMSQPEIDGGQGTEAEWRCHVAVSTSERAVAYEVRWEYAPTRCVDAVMHPDGGFFLRGEIWEASVGEARGFTSRIDAGGEILWSLDDAEFAAGEAEGQFQGDYQGAVTGLAHDPVGDHVMALAEGDRQLGGDQSRSLIQAFSIDAEDGELIGSGKTFGPVDDDVIVEVVARDGEFLVITVDDRGEQTRFHSHVVDFGAFRFEPAQMDWSRHELVTPVVYRHGVGTFYLWRGESDEFGLSRVEDLDSQVWSTGLSDMGEVDGSLRSLGRPRQLRVSDEVVMVRHRDPGRHAYLRFLSAEDGEELVVVAERELTAHDEVGVVHGVDGALVLLAIEPVEGRMWEYEVEIGEFRDPPEGDGDTGGCATVATGRGAGWIFGLWALWWLRRRDPDCQTQGRALS